MFVCRAKPLGGIPQMFLGAHKLNLKTTFRPDKDIEPLN